MQSWEVVLFCYQDLTRNLAISNRSRVSCAHNTSRGHLGL